MSNQRADWSDHVIQARRYDDELALERARLAEEARLELARLKAELLTTISHELRTPLTLVHGYAELLADRAASLSPAEVAEMGGEILAGSRALVRLVDDLLDFSRLDRERLHGGQVGVRSAPGLGACFWFTLPSADSEHPDQALDRRTRPERTQPEGRPAVR